MNKLKNMKVRFTSFVDYNDNQRIDFECEAETDTHGDLKVYENGVLIGECGIAFINGAAKSYAMLPVQGRDINSLWQITDRDGNVLWSEELLWKKPREWTLFYMISSHTDIGLHNSQYIQRYNSVKFLDDAIELNEKSGNTYHYVMEGTWFWSNYEMDKGNVKATEIADKYIKTNKIGVCAGLAGNHTQTYGLEEMCRSTYEKRKLYDKWGITSNTMTMIDNNGISWSLVQPYAEAGYENIIFAPNIWNPIYSTIWNLDTDKHKFMFNPCACGSGSRMDIRYSSALPMVFYWCDKEEKNKLLVWGSASYHYGGSEFGVADGMPLSLAKIENNTSRTLSILEEKVPYDVWLFAAYDDDEKPNMRFTDALTNFNKKWKWPKFKSLSNPDEPFCMLRSKFDEHIPVVRGDLTGGWYQHPISAAEILTQKMYVDRLLPTAEKLAVAASVLNDEYLYPRTEFDRAWYYLLLNDEHSYGTSGYQGRRVFETWMQHRDWIEKAQKTAEDECCRAINAIAQTVKLDYGVIVFNPTLLERSEVVEYQGKYAYVPNVPSFGYTTLKLSDFSNINTKVISNNFKMENNYYILKFDKNGSVKSIFDKELKKEILDVDGEFCCNEFVYTNDNHKSYRILPDAACEITESEYDITFTAVSNDELTGAEIIRKTILPKNEKRIDFINDLNHLSDMWNTNRYYRYCYFAFPIKVENSKRLCHLNGCIAEYGKDVTGHGTDVYMAVRDWCCAENGEFGAALIQPDTSLTEFDIIHPDKTDCKNLGGGSSIYSYVANDWLQMHIPGGKYLNYKFRYSLVSYKGSHKDAHIADIAERITTPLVCARTADGGKDTKRYSFAKPSESVSLLTLKPSEDNDGVIARLYTKGETVEYNTQFLRLAANETQLRNSLDKVNGFITLKINTLPIKCREDVAATGNPAPIGSVYTGLITDPMAGHSENPGQLYLLWGKNMEENLSHYELYRSETDGFIPSADNFVANVELEDYRVSRYIDTGLKNDCLYFYRVRAVNTDGDKGSFSKQFCGRTRVDD